MHAFEVNFPHCRINIVDGRAQRAASGCDAQHPAPRGFQAARPQAGSGLEYFRSTSLDSGDGMSGSGLARIARRSQDYTNGWVAFPAQFDALQIPARGPPESLAEIAVKPVHQGLRLGIS